MSARRPSRLGFRQGATLALVASAGFFVGAASAGTCGDDVDGQRVACGCGDVVVSDTRLRADDPIVAAPCGGDGLVILAAPGAKSLRLDLGGQTLIGEGRGVGVRVLRAGGDGAVIVGGDAGATAGIVHFGTGLRAANPNAVRELQGVAVSGNVRDGVYARVADGALSDIRAERNGRDGVRVGGRAPRLDGIEAGGNGRYGVVARSRGAQVDVSAADNHVRDLRVRDERKAGKLR